MAGLSPNMAVCPWLHSPNDYFTYIMQSLSECVSIQDHAKKGLGTASDLHSTGYLPGQGGINALSRTALTRGLVQGKFQRYPDNTFICNEAVRCALCRVAALPCQYKAEQSSQGMVCIGPVQIPRHKTPPRRWTYTGSVEYSMYRVFTLPRYSYRTITG